MRRGRLSFSADPALTKEALSPVWEAAPLSFAFVSLGTVVIVLVPTGNPPSLRFGHPDVTFGRYRLSSLGYCAGAAAFSEHVLRITVRRLSQPRYWSVPVHTFLRSCRGTHPLGCSASPCFAAESTREGTLMSLPEGAPARPGWGVKFGHPDVTTDDTAPLASPPRRIVG